MKKQTSAVILGIMIGSITIVQAADFSVRALEQAAAAYNKPNGALVAMQHLEQQDNGFVPLMLNRCFQYGSVGCPKDLKKAQTYESKKNEIQQQLQRLAANNNAEVYNWLGNFERAKVTEDGYRQAFSYFEKSAALSNYYGLLALGEMHRLGQGVPQNNNKAIEFYQKSANLGSPLAMINLGIMYENGQGGMQDYKKAIEWYEKSANLGNSDAMLNLGVMYVNGQGVMQDYKKAIEWFEKSADLGNVFAMKKLGVVYFQGSEFGVGVDIRKSAEFFQKAADLGDIQALNWLSLLYRFGMPGVEVDTKRAIEFLQKAADLGDGDSIYLLGEWYYNGNSIKRDYKKAVKYFEAAAELGHSESMYKLGIMYGQGEGVFSNSKKTYEFLKNAAELGNVNAMAFLSVIYEKGLFDVRKNNEKAMEWYQKAVASNVTMKEILDEQLKPTIAEKVVNSIGNTITGIFGGAVDILADPALSAAMKQQTTSMQRELDRQSRQEIDAKAWSAQRNLERSKIETASKPSTSYTASTPVNTYSSQSSASTSSSSSTKDGSISQGSSTYNTAAVEREKRLKLQEQKKLEQQQANEAKIAKAQKEREEEEKRREQQIAELEKQRQIQLAKDKALLEKRAEKEKQERERIAQKQREAQEKDAYLAGLRNSIRLQAIKCYGDNYVVGTRPNTSSQHVSGINVHYRVTCPGGGRYDGIAKNFIGMGTGCFTGDTFAHSGNLISKNLTCKAEDMTVDVQKVTGTR